MSDACYCGELLPKKLCLACQLKAEKERADRFQTVTDYALSKSGSGPGDLQGYIERLWEQRDRAVRALPKAADILTNCCMLLDVIKIEWGEAWSDWDQSVRDAASAWLKEFYMLAAVASQEGEHTK